MEDAKGRTAKKHFQSLKFYKSIAKSRNVWLFRIFRSSVKALSSKNWPCEMHLVDLEG